MEEIEKLKKSHSAVIKLARELVADNFPLEEKGDRMAATMMIYGHLMAQMRSGLNARIMKKTIDDSTSGMLSKLGLGGN